jgi:hypothetical protein
MHPTVDVRPRKRRSETDANRRRDVIGSVAIDACYFCH